MLQLWSMLDQAIYPLFCSFSSFLNWGYVNAEHKLWKRQSVLCSFSLSFLHILTAKRRSARKLLCQSVGETQRGQMTTSNPLYRYMLECTYMQPNENEIMIILTKINNNAHHMFSLSLGLWALLRCLHHSFLCTPDWHRPSCAFCPLESIVLTISLQSLSCPIERGFKQISSNGIHRHKDKKRLMGTSWQRKCRFVVWSGIL